MGGCPKARWKQCTLAGSLMQNASPSGSSKAAAHFCSNLLNQLIGRRRRSSGSAPKLSQRAAHLPPVLGIIKTANQRVLLASDCLACSRPSNSIKARRLVGRQGNGEHSLSLAQKRFQQSMASAAGPTDRKSDLALGRRSFRFELFGHLLAGCLAARGPFDSSLLACDTCLCAETGSWQSQRWPNCTRATRDAPNRWGLAMWRKHVRLGSPHFSA